MHRNPLVAFAAVLALVIPLLVVGAQPAFASHFKSVEASVVVDGVNETATLRIVSTWASSGTFSPSLTAPDSRTVSLSGSGTSGPLVAPLQASSSTGTTTRTQEFTYDLSGLTQAGRYEFYATSNARVTLFSAQTNSSTFAFEVGFNYDPADPSATVGPPTFSSTVRTNVARGVDFTQNLGAVDPDGGAVTYSLIESTSSPDYGAPVTGYNLTGLMGPTDLISLAPDGTISIPGTVSDAILTTQGSTATNVAFKVKATDAQGEYVTRDITFNIQQASNNAPALTSITNGQTFTVAAGTTSTVTLTASDTVDTSDILTLTATGLPTWATLSAPSGTNPVTRTLTLAPLSGTAAGTTTINIEATDDDGTFPLTAIAAINLVIPAGSPPPAPAPAPAAPSPVVEPGGGLPVTPPGVSTGSVGGVPVVPTPARPTPGAASFQVGSVQTSIDVAVAGAGTVDGAGDAPVLRATRDRVATIAGGGMRPGGIAEVWMPLPDGGSRQVALLPIGADGTFDGALPFTGELDGRGPLPIGDRTIQLFGTGADGQLTVINVGVRVEQPGPLAPEPERSPGAPPTLAPGQSLATVAGVPTAVTVTPVPDASSTRIEGDGWLMDVDVPDGTVRDEAGAPLIEIVNGTDSRVRGTGFLPGTRAYVWLMSDPTFLGEVTVGSDGSFSGDVPIDGVAAGEHTLQLSGVGTDGFVRAANLGVVLLGDGMPRPTRIDAGEGPAGTPGGMPFGVPVGALLALGGLALGVALTRQRAGLARS